MNRQGLVKLSLGCSHLQGHSHSLQDFIDASADGVHSYHVFFSVPKMADQLEKRTEFQIVFSSQRVKHIVELARVHLYLVLTPLGHSFLFIQTDYSDGGMGKYDSWDEREVHFDMSLLTMEESLDQSASCLNGYRSQLWGIRHVAYCIHFVHRSILVLIHHHISPAVYLHSCLL